MGHLNSFSASGGGYLNKNFPKIQMPGGLPGGMFKLRFDWYISVRMYDPQTISIPRWRTVKKCQAFAIF